MLESVTNNRPDVTGAPKPPPARHWRLAGGFALGHVALLLAGLALQRSPLFSEGTAGIQRSYVEGPMARTLAGGMIEVLGFLLLGPALAFLASAIGRRTTGGRWATQTALLAGMAYVAVTMAVGLPAGAAALYGAQQGLDVEAAFAINNIRIFGYFLSLSLLGLHAIGLAIAARQDQVLTRWVGVRVARIPGFPRIRTLVRFVSGGASVCGMAPYVPSSSAAAAGAGVAPADPISAESTRVLAWLGSLRPGEADDGVPDAERVDRIALLERVKAAAGAAQAGELVAFGVSQIAAQESAKLNPRRIGRGIADQIALAATSPPPRARAG